MIHLILESNLAKNLVDFMDFMDFMDLMTPASHAMYSITAT